MHRQVRGQVQWGTGLRFMNKPNNRRCHQWPLRWGFGRFGKANIYPKEPNKTLSVSWEVSQLKVVSLERRSILIMSPVEDDHAASLYPVKATKKQTDQIHIKVCLHCPLRSEFLHIKSNLVILSDCLLFPSFFFFKWLNQIFEFLLTFPCPHSC